jgi:DNA-binding response OmpR family regulator
VNILIIEDDLLFNQFYSMFFQSKGVNVVSTYSIAEARGILQSSAQFDAIVLDNQLTDGEGLQLVPPLIGQYPDAAILMVSANDSADFFLQAYASGLDDYAVKPVNVDLLWVKICRAVEVRQLQRVSRQQQAELANWVAQEQQEQELAGHVLATLTQRLQQMPAYIQVKTKPSSSFSGDILLQQQGQDGSQYLLLADAMGHGLAAAISLMPVLEVFQSMSQKSLPLSNIVFELNKKLNRQLPADRFVAAIFIRLDPRTSELEVWNGGMPPLLIIECVQKKISKAESKNMALGILNEQEIDVSVEKFKWTTGSYAVGFTDGLTDTEFVGHGQFSADFLAETWLEQPEEAFRGLEQCIDGLSHAVDDISVFSIHFDKYADLISAGMKLNDKKDGRLCLEFKITGSALSQVDAPLKIVQTVSAYGMHQSLNNTLFSVLTELYLNALEHGVLKLNSEMKQAEDGFIKYYSLREQRLSSLVSDDSISLVVDWCMSDNSIHLTVADSGSGFDYQAMNVQRSTDYFYYGRGINMIYSLCAEVNFKGCGNEVTAVIIG